MLPRSFGFCATLREARMRRHGRRRSGGSVSQELKRVGEASWAACAPLHSISLGPKAGEGGLQRRANRCYKRARAGAAERDAPADPSV